MKYHWKITKFFSFSILRPRLRKKRCLRHRFFLTCDFLKYLFSDFNFLYCTPSTFYYFIFCFIISSNPYIIIFFLFPFFSNHRSLTCILRPTVFSHFTISGYFNFISIGPIYFFPNNFYFFTFQVFN